MKILIFVMIILLQISCSTNQEKKKDVPVYNFYNREIEAKNFINTNHSEKTFKKDTSIEIENILKSGKILNLLVIKQGNVDINNTLNQLSNRFKEYDNFNIVDRTIIKQYIDEEKLILEGIINDLGNMQFGKLQGSNFILVLSTTKSKINNIMSKQIIEKLIDLESGTIKAIDIIELEVLLNNYNNEIKEIISFKLNGFTIVKDPVDNKYYFK